MSSGSFWVFSVSAAVSSIGLVAAAWSTLRRVARGEPSPASKLLLDTVSIYKEWLRAVAQPFVTSPPRGLLIDICLPPDRAEDVLYNLLNRYDYWVEKHGVRWARVIFLAQSVGSILTFWIDWALKRLKLLKMLVSN